MAPLFTSPPTYRCRSPTGEKPYPLHRGNLLLSCISPSTWGNQRRARSHYHFHAIRAEARGGDAMATRKSGEPSGEPRGGDTVARRGDAVEADARSVIGAHTWRRSSRNP